MSGRLNLDFLNIQNLYSWFKTEGEKAYKGCQDVSTKISQHLSTVTDFLYVAYKTIEVTLRCFSVKTSLFNESSDIDPQTNPLSLKEQLRGIEKTTVIEQMPYLIKKIESELEPKQKELQIRQWFSECISLNFSSCKFSLRNKALFPINTCALPREHTIEKLEKIIARLRILNSEESLLVASHIEELKKACFEFSRSENNPQNSILNVQEVFEGAINRNRDEIRRLTLEISPLKKTLEQNREQLQRAQNQS
jgi:hypothetical protein